MGEDDEGVGVSNIPSSSANAKRTRKRSRAYITLTLGNTLLGTIRLLLFEEEVPRTCRNFTALIQREEGSGYLGSRFHRIIKGFMAQGGDYERADGTGGRSIYGLSFPDENFYHSHSCRGTLAMANSGSNTNGSQFYLTFRPTPHLDGRHVVFGCVEEGDEESWRVLDALEKVTTVGTNNAPAIPVTVTDCGVVASSVSVAEDDAAGSVAEAKESKRDLIRRKYLAGGADVCDEIDLDDDDDNNRKDGDFERRKQNKERTIGAAPADSDEIDLDDDEEAAVPGQTDPQLQGNCSMPKLPCDASEKNMNPLRERLLRLKMKINQSRALNHGEVLAEGERLGTGQEGITRERRKLAKQDKQSRRKEWEESVMKSFAGKEEAKFMSEQASDSLRKATKKAARAEVNRFSVDDYYNPEGQHRNYERSLKSIPTDSHQPNNNKGRLLMAGGAVFDPTEDGGNDGKSDREGARRLAAELRRRAEKGGRFKRNRMEFEASDVSYINQRNKRFNEKIGRNFDKHTAEIRQNLERGTAS